MGTLLNDGSKTEQRYLSRLLCEDAVDTDIAENAAEEETDPLFSVPGLLVQNGLNYCGSKEGLMKSLEIFFKGIDNKSAEIEELWKKRDLENYTIKVHALKSSARLIGAEQLSHMAEALEYAGKAKDMEKIDRETEELLSVFRGFSETLRPIFRE